MLMFRRVGLVVLALAAIGVFFALAPSEVELPELPEAADYADLIDAEAAINELNAERTESAPQQQVVNGWYANDLLSILATENAQLVSQMDSLLAIETLPETQDDRPAALLVIGVFAIALVGITTPKAESLRVPAPVPESLPIPIPEPEGDAPTAEV